jgi:hypothetical protein
MSSQQSLRSGSSLSRCGVLLIAIISPALLGTQFRCVAISNPTVATARIEQVEPTVPRVGDIVQVSGSGNGTPPLQFAWDFGDGEVAPGKQAAHAYIAPGSYRITFMVRDANGNIGSDSSQVTVASRIPSSVLSLVLVSDAVAGRPVLFAALPVDERASSLSYAWTFGGGQFAVGPRAVAIFPVAGMYLASVTATNELGAVVVAQLAFHVSAEP